MRKITYLILTIIFISCGENKVEKNQADESSSITEGFWERIGTIQMVNGVEVDTIFFKDVEGDKKPRQIKAYVRGYFAWLSNQDVTQRVKDDYKEINEFPWVSGAGGFGSYSFSEKGEINMRENMTNIIGNVVGWNSDFRDNVRNNGVNNLTFTSNVNGNKYTQLMKIEEVPNENSNFQTGIEYAEYYEKLDEIASTKIDGVWKHIANVKYVNGIAVDTIGVPEGLDDHKMFHKGNVIVNFDFTKAKAGDPNWGGAGLAGTFTYKDNLLVEKFNLSTGNWRATGGEWPPTPYDIEWIDDDSFVQIWKFVARQGENGELEFVENESKETNGLLHVRVK